VAVFRPLADDDQRALDQASPMRSLIFLIHIPAA
jgi:hypothetical protein